MKNENDIILEKLYSYADIKYKNFSEKLLNCKSEIIGVSIPNLRKIAKELALSNWKVFFNNQQNCCEEVIILKGLALGYAKIDFDEFCLYLKKYFAMCDSWSSTDTVASSLKIIKKHKSEILQLIVPFLKSGVEFEMRFAIIILMDYYIDDEHIDFIFETIKNIHSNFYYVKMAVAWLVSVCAIKQRDKTIEFLSKNILDKWTQNKAIQKCRESFRITKEDKVLLNNLKIK